MSANLELPPPRIWTAQQFADFFGMSLAWVYKKTEKKCGDPLPRIKGIGVIRFDTESPAFKEWIARHLIDNKDSHA